MKSYMPLVLEECRNSFKGIELEDRAIEGWLALLYAIRTHKSNFGNFEDYMILQVRGILKQKNKEAWAAKKIESRISLDAPLIKTEGSLKLQDFINGIPHDETLLDVKCFIQSLSPFEQHIVFLLMDSQNISAVSDKLGLTISQIKCVVTNLQNKAAAYFGPDAISL